MFNYGDVGVENILKLDLLSKDELEKSINFKLDCPYASVTFHPVTLEMSDVERQCNELFEAIETFSNMKFIFTKANADYGGEHINRILYEHSHKIQNLHLFDSLGTLISCAKEMNMVDKEGKVKDLGKMLYTDVASTIVGATLGTSTVTSFVESAAGIGVGARTGLSAVVTSIGFLLALFLAPLISIVPAYATAPALVVVGVYMFKQLIGLNFNDLKVLFPAFVIVFTMPLTYSISTGLALGFLAYIIIHFLTGDFKKLNLPLLFIGIICLIHTIV